MAEFLARGAHLPEDVDGAAVIEHLVQGEQPEEPDGQGSDGEADGRGAAPVEAAAESVIEDLTRQDEPPADVAEPAKPSSRSKADPAGEGASAEAADEDAPEQADVDRDVIDDLLGGDRK